MRTRWAALVVLVALAVPAVADGPMLDDPVVTLTDSKLPLWELRPLDRRVYVVSIDGNWKKAPRKGVSYHLEVRFPDGTVYAHKPIDSAMFEKGEMRFMVPEYMLVRTKSAKGGKLTFFVTERASVGAEPETISDELEITWPMKRRVTSRAPDTKFSPTRPVDAFPLPDDGK